VPGNVTSWPVFQPTQFLVAHCRWRRAQAIAVARRNAAGAPRCDEEGVQVGAPAAQVARFGHRLHAAGAATAHFRLAAGAGHHPVAESARPRPHRRADAPGWHSPTRHGHASSGNRRRGRAPASRPCSGPWDRPGRPWSSPRSDATGRTRAAAGQQRFSAACCGSSVGAWAIC
jgi:hypothetical protein